MAEDRRARLVGLLEGAAEAHHAYEVELGEADPRWPEWYAGWLLENGLSGLVKPLPDALSLTSTLVAADHAYKQQARDEPWPEFYADFILGKYREDE